MQPTSKLQNFKRKALNNSLHHITINVTSAVHSVQLNAGGSAEQL
ncbi:MAG: hypothetical protein ACTS6G_00285 [Candidatus Hodgkinia cicadicola]